MDFSIVTIQAWRGFRNLGESSLIFTLFKLIRRFLSRGTSRNVITARPESTSHHNSGVNLTARFDEGALAVPQGRAGREDIVDQKERRSILPGEAAGRPELPGNGLSAIGPGEAGQGRPSPTSLNPTGLHRMGHVDSQAPSEDLRLIESALAAACRRKRDRNQDTLGKPRA